MFKDFGGESVGGGRREEEDEQREEMGREVEKEEEDVEMTYNKVDSRTGQGKGRGYPERMREIAGSMEGVRCRVVSFLYFYGGKLIFVVKSMDGIWGVITRLGQPGQPVTATAGGVKRVTCYCWVT
jgi:hypothetical protein